jgi:4-hydroxy-tetrahydrodipicolinate synthase
VNHFLSGSMVAIVTPMKGGRIDYASLETLYRIHAAAGTDAVIVCGTTGESATLTHDEQKEAIEHAVGFFQNELGPTRPKLIAGTGSNATHEAVSLTEFAVSKGVGAVLVVAPYYNKPTPKGQVLHYKRIAEAAGNTPVVLYSVPGRTVIKLGLETILELAKVENIIGIKDASGDLNLISEVIREAPEGFVVVSGEDNLTFPMMALGATGVISVTANILPELFREMVHLCLEGKFVEARALHHKQFSLTQSLFCETSPIPIKTALNLMAGTKGPGGIPWPEAGELRLPLCEISEAGAARLRRELERLGLVSASKC